MCPSSSRNPEALPVGSRRQLSDAGAASRDETLAALRASEARARTLATVALRLSTLHEQRSVLAAVCEETGRALGVPGVAVYLYIVDQNAFQLSATWGIAETLPSNAAIPGRAGDILQSEGSPLLTASLAASADLLPDVAALSHLRVRAVASQLLQQEGRVIGILHVYLTDPAALPTSDLELLTGIAELAVGPIGNALILADATERLRHLHALRNIDLAILGSLDLRVTLDMILGQVIDTLSSDAATVLLFNRETRRLEYGAGRGFRTQAVRYGRARAGFRLADRTLKMRKMVVIPAFLGSDQEFEESLLFAQEEFEAYVGVPLVSKGEVKGVLEVFQRSPRHPSAKMLDFLQALAGQAAIAIENAGLFADLQRANAELSLAYDATLQGWSRALDLRDEATEGHAERVAEVAVRLAEAMGVQGEELVHLQRGALLHDIGKIGVPDQILRKPGPLTAEEWAIMQQHPVYAFELLSPIAFLRRAIDIPYCHHERWDGSGYPRHLKGEQIPCAARIFSVVDVWDALRSDRPYRPAWSEDRVRAYLVEMAGIHFEPRVVARFLALLGE